jgi:HemK-related putative methylase
MTVHDVLDAARTELPRGEDGSLWSTRREYGVFAFRGSPVRIEVPRTDEVLFPTDCGLSLLAAVHDDPGTEVRGGRVLDIGCGSGIYSVALLAAGAGSVTALDVNPEAAEVTRANAVDNGLDVDRLTCVTADLAEFTARERFDLVVANPPHLPYSPTYARENGLQLALVGGPDGRSLYDAVIDRADDLVAPGGTLLMAHSSLADVERTTGRMASLGYRCRTVRVFEMDIPLRAYAEHADALFHQLDLLRRQGRAVFHGNRFFVHVLAFQKARAAVPAQERLT